MTKYNPKMIHMIDDARDFVQRISEHASDEDGYDERLLMAHFQQGVTEVLDEIGYPSCDRNTYKIRRGIAHTIGALLLLGESIQ
jgi:hypothetical protein